jgi:hypothetical protein
MASTRNINYSGNYCLEQKQFSDSARYTLYPHSQYGSAYTTMMPGDGACPGQIPWTSLSHNAVQIESFLFGINSTNLVEPKPHTIVPELINHDSVNFFEKSKRIMIPQPLVLEKSQRPFPTPN